jgi:hypothetical protein
LRTKIPVFRAVVYTIGGEKMIQWWWMIVTFLAGMMAGIFFLALVSGNRGDDD